LVANHSERLWIPAWYMFSQDEKCQTLTVCEGDPTINCGAKYGGNAEVNTLAKHVPRLRGNDKIKCAVAARTGMICGFPLARE